MNKMIRFAPFNGDIGNHLSKSHLDNWVLLVAHTFSELLSDLFTEQAVMIAVFVIELWENFDHLDAITRIHQRK